MSDTLHDITLDVVGDLEDGVPIGGEIALQLRAACSCGRNFDGTSARVSLEGTLVATPIFLGQDEEDGVWETDEFVVRAPETLGEHRLTIVLPRHESEGAVHAEHTVEVPFTTIPQATSLAVWGIPASVCPGDRFGVKIGARSAGGHALAGVPVEIRDEQGACVGRGVLGDQPWAGSDALYWTEIDLTAPAEGVFACTAHLADGNVGVPHTATSTSFSFLVVRTPEHTLTVTLRDQNGDPLPDAYVRLGQYRGTTDERGFATVAAPRGHYEVAIWKSGFKTPRPEIDFNGDAALELQAEKIWRDDPWAQWL